MSYKIEKINPSDCSFVFRMGEYDCYALRTGRCSLYLSDEEAKGIHESEKNTSDSNVMYCRNLKESLLNDNYFEDPSQQSKNYSIRIHKRNCGHYVFTDGQHRSCIAKHLNLQTMYVNKEISDFTEINCPVCFNEHTKKENNFFTSFLSIFKRKENEIPYHFIDSDYIVFQNKKP